MYEEGQQVNYLLLLKRIPGIHAQRAMWHVHCALCGGTAYLRIKSPVGERENR